MHIIDLSDPSNPQRVLEHQFTTSEGRPLDVAVCGNEMAVVLASSVTDVYEGHVMFAQTFSKGDTKLSFQGTYSGTAFSDHINLDGFGNSQL